MESGPKPIPTEGKKLEFSKVNMARQEHIHFIAVGGRIMHTLALDLHKKGYRVTGSDDEIYDPSLSNLRAAGIAPEAMGWFPEKLNGVDAVILGMHARVDNPELLQAQELGLPIYSYPEYVASLCKDKKVIMVAGSHGKTSTTAMIMHVFRQQGLDFDYLVGAPITGFEGMVRLTDAEVIIVEGDEYLNSPIDRRPKFIHFDPNICVITGIAWDHINVFKTFEDYTNQFANLINKLSENTHLLYYADDPTLVALAQDKPKSIGYAAFQRGAGDSIRHEESIYPIQVIGKHNLANLKAAFEVCRLMGMDADTILNAFSTFMGADRRMQLLGEGSVTKVFFDFAHAPSKVRATTKAVKDWYMNMHLVAVLELHTYSSLNPEFLPQYAKALDQADKAIVFYDAHTLKIKRMKPLEPSFIKEAFQRTDLVVCTTMEELTNAISTIPKPPPTVLLMMSSGRFGGLDLKQYIQ